MGLGSKLRAATSSQDVTEPLDIASNAPPDIEQAATRSKAGSIDAAADDKVPRPNEHAQDGVQAIEAMALSWSKYSLIAVFAKYVYVLLSCCLD